MKRVPCVQSYEVATRRQVLDYLPIRGLTVTCPSCSADVILVRGDGDAWIFKAHNRAALNASQVAVEAEPTADGRRVWI